MEGSMAGALTESQVRTFHRDGLLLLPAVLSNEDLAPLIDEFQDAVDEKAGAAFRQGKISSLHEGEPFERRLALIDRESEEVFYALFGKSHHGPALWDLMRHPKILDIVETLVGPEIYCHPTFNVRPKLPAHERTVVPWHQDSAYLTPDADDTTIVACWIPLVDATAENGCMELIVGSHRHGIVPHKNVFHYLDIDAEDLPPGEQRVVPVANGDVLLLHNLTVHRSLPNVSDTIRWSVDLRYQDPAQPTGRVHVPGFLVRSAARPGDVVTDREHWIRSLHEAGQFDDGRPKLEANPFALRTAWQKPSGPVEAAR
jgi:phytanoyl-CoA hydroxylase